MRPVRPRSFVVQLFGDLASEHSGNSSQAVAPLRCTSSAGAPLKVLLVEDNEINALLARVVLEKAGASVIRAARGQDATAQAKSVLDNGNGFDFVLMDIHMPDMDGIEAAGRIRDLYEPDARAGIGRPPIVALTANAFPEDRAAYLESGLDDYLAKPFEKNELLSLIVRWQSVEARQRTGEAEAASGPGMA